MQCRLRNACRSFLAHLPHCHRGAYLGKAKDLSVRWVDAPATTDESLKEYL